MEFPTPIRRDLHFALPAERVQNWHGQGVHVSQFFNTMSLYFPEGEKFFISSVRHYRDRVTDPTLQAAVSGFIGQEAMHGREHAEFNLLMEQSGLPAASVEKKSLDRLMIAKRIMPPSMHLSMTIALEHLTAIMAAHLLRTDAVMAGSHAAYARLWRWHALEETEHKAVAFDVWKTVMPNTLGSYLKRIWGLISTSLHFWILTAIFHWQMVRAIPAARRESHWRGYGRLLKFLFISPGAWIALAPAWFAYFKPGFHPWQHDNRAVLGELDALTLAVSSAAIPPNIVSD